MEDPRWDPQPMKAIESGGAPFAPKGSMETMAPPDGYPSELNTLLRGGTNVSMISEDDSEDYNSGAWAGDHFDAATGTAGAPGKSGMFIDANAMKEKLRQNMCKPVYDVANFYHKTGIFRYIATNKYFEGATLSVIALNALWISVDTDHNDAEVLITAAPLFQIMEQFFCAYFTFEWFVRYCAFKRKRNGCRDAWFVFDSLMVVIAVAETWGMTLIMIANGGAASGGGGNASILRLARLLRLSRMMRMARLLRSMPELMILIKGMVAAMRSVFFVMLLLALVTYVFGIMLCQLLADTEIGENSFPTVPLAMHTLILDGCFLDSLGTVVKALGQESLVYAALFYMYVLVSALTVLNMLIGVLCEVVSAVASTEKEELTVSFVREKLQDVMRNSGLDEDGDGEISKQEFCKILEVPEACRTLSEVGVDVMGLIDIADFIFDEAEDEQTGEPKNLTFQDLMEIVLQLRGSNNATVKDVVDLRKFINNSNNRLEGKIEKSNEKVRGSMIGAVARASCHPGSMGMGSMSSMSSMGSMSDSRQSSHGSHRGRRCSTEGLSDPSHPTEFAMSTSYQSSPRAEEDSQTEFSNDDARDSMMRNSGSPPLTPQDTHGRPALRQSRSAHSIDTVITGSKLSTMRRHQNPRVHKLLQTGEAELDELIECLAVDLRDSDEGTTATSSVLPGVPTDMFAANTSPLQSRGQSKDPQELLSPHNEFFTDRHSPRQPLHKPSRKELEEMHSHLLRLKEAINAGLPAVGLAQKHFRMKARQEDPLSPYSPDCNGSTSRGLHRSPSPPML